ncbi:MAG TPA: pyrimidine 5'-nucleotidase [Rhizomicrobium sp.]|nr:pyrimidine 5'-nucleotidase [Rhizomicrobium sp.]
MTQFIPPAAPVESSPPGPDFAHVRDWIFDLDNTLYLADNGIFAQIDGRMTSYVAALLSLDRDSARTVQKRLYRDHGTTLAGLINVYRIDPEPYLTFVHDLDLSGLEPDPDLGEALARLKGRRFIFTNGCRNHAARILEKLGLVHLFHQIWDIRTIGFVPKPGREAYQAVVAEAGLEPASTAMFDDIARNLVVPHEMGMTTVWLNCQSDWSRQGPEFPIASREHIDHEIHDLRYFLNSIGI